MLNRLISLVVLFSILNIDSVYSETNFIFPQKKPSIFKKSQKEIQNVLNKNLPAPKPVLEKKVDNKPEVSEQKKDDKELAKKNVKENTTKKVSLFVLPQKKPITYKVSSKEIQSSKVLNKKDFEKAKETIKFIKEKKWNSALKSAQRVKDSEFRKLITWMHLKTTRNVPASMWAWNGRTFG